MTGNNMNKKFISPEVFLQQKIDKTIPKPMQAMYQERIQSMKAGFYWALEYNEQELNKSKENIDISKKSDKLKA
jgi:hypothetical protein